MRPHELDIDPRGRYKPCEAAKILGINVSTIYRWIKDGRIKYHVHRHTGNAFLLGRDIRSYWMAYQ